MFKNVLMRLVQMWSIPYDGMLHTINPKRLTAHYRRQNTYCVLCFEGRSTFPFYEALCAISCYIEGQYIDIL